MWPSFTISSTTRFNCRSILFGISRSIMCVYFLYYRCWLNHHDMIISFSWYYYRPQQSWGRVIFSESLVKNSVHGGGMHGRGHAWQGTCIARGHVWQGVYMAGGHVWWGACMVGVGGLRGTQSKNGQYWYAFLLLDKDYAASFLQVLSYWHCHCHCYLRQF